MSVSPAYRIWFWLTRTTLRKVTSAVVALVLAGGITAGALSLDNSLNECGAGFYRGSAHECIGVTDGSYDFFAGLAGVPAPASQQMSEVLADIRALNSRVSGQYATIALLLPMTSADTPPIETVHAVEGAYLAQSWADSPADPRGPRIRLLLANPGTDSDQWQPVADQLAGLAGAPGNLLAVTGHQRVHWPDAGRGRPADQREHSRGGRRDRGRRPGQLGRRRPLPRTCPGGADQQPGGAGPRPVPRQPGHQQAERGPRRGRRQLRRPGEAGPVQLHAGPAVPGGHGVRAGAVQLAVRQRDERHRGPGAEHLRPAGHQVRLLRRPAGVPHRLPQRAAQRLPDPAVHRGDRVGRLAPGERPQPQPGRLRRARQADPRLRADRRPADLGQPRRRADVRLHDVVVPDGSSLPRSPAPSRFPARSSTARWPTARR